MVELYAPVSEERGIRLESAVASGAQVQGSRQLLAQALANLLDNAIKFTPDGGHIRVLLKSQSAGPPSAGPRSAGPPLAGPEVIVEDDGPGIPADKREAVLGRRVRLDGTRNVPGSGLGLSLVAAVTKLHGARLTLDDAAPGLRVSLQF
jgi:signal transduction histidine kinase